MRTLLELLARYSHWLLFVVLEVVSLVLLFQFNHYQRSVWLTTANTAVGHINAMEQEVLHYISLGTINEALTRRNLILEQELEGLQWELRALTHDSTYTERLHARQMRGHDLLPAHIVTNSVTHRDNYITIDRGTADGIEAEMGVVSGTGIVGIVYMTSNHYAVVMPLLNSHSHISCRLRGSSYFGYLNWDGRHPLYATLDDLPRHARIAVGDVVETSGFSSVFPAGIFVGKVVAIEDSDDGLGYKLRVHLGTDLSRLRDVCVVRHTFHDELWQLEQQVQP